jgi:endonuclease/exonuclease/phosphatase (EEP) superfamily protein YafD
MLTTEGVIFWVLGALTFVVALATLLPLLRHPHWAVRGLDFPRLQIAFVALVLLVLQLTLLKMENAASWLMVATTIASLVGQLWWIAPYTVLWRRQVKTARKRDPDYALTILTSNVLTSNRDARALIQLVQKHAPDVLVTLESNRWWEEQLTVLEKDMPFTIKCPLENLYGMHVYSRLPLHEPTCRYLIEENVPSMHALVELRSGDQVRIHFLHPAPPSPTENSESKERDAELVIVGRNVADSKEPIIVTGDLNDVAWSPTTRLFRKVSGLLDPRVGRGLYATFHANHWWLRWPLDHLFHSEHFTLDSMARLPSIGSDHFPLMTRLMLAPERGRDQEPLPAEDGDQEYARSLAREQGASKKDVPEPGE